MKMSQMVGCEVSGFPRRLGLSTVADYPTDAPTTRRWQSHLRQMEV
jgi:hypothetical protein